MTHQPPARQPARAESFAPRSGLGQGRAIDGRRGEAGAPVVQGDRTWAGFTYRVSDRARLGLLRAACLAEIVTTTGCTVHTPAGRSGHRLQVWGARPLVEHLAATLDEVAETMEAAALVATLRYGRWLRDQTDPDHTPAERRNLRRAWRRTYLPAWANAYAHRLLSLATGRPDHPATGIPPIGHHSAHTQARHDVAHLHPRLLQDTAALVAAQRRRLNPLTKPRTSHLSTSDARRRAPRNQPAVGPGLIGPGLQVSCLPGAPAAATGRTLARIIAIGATTSLVHVDGERQPRRIPNHLLRPTWAPAITAQIHGRGLPVTYPNGRPLPGWQWLTWTIAEHLEHQHGQRPLITPAAPDQLVIVACGARKRPEPWVHPAGQLYTGSYHAAARAAAQAITAPGGRVMILSYAGADVSVGRRSYVCENGA
jgi:hypothetical protein